MNRLGNETGVTKQFSYISQKLGEHLLVELQALTVRLLVTEERLQPSLGNGMEIQSQNRNLVCGNFFF